MKIYLWDYTLIGAGADPNSWLSALIAAFPAQLFCRPPETRVPLPHQAPERHDAFGDPNAVLFVHSGLGATWSAKANEVTVQCNIVLVSRSVGLLGKSNERRNMHFCYWRPIDFLNHTDPNGSQEVAQFVHQIVAGERQGIDWSLLQPKYASATFSVLCEAWYFTRGTTSQPLGNLVVHAPMTTEHWFKPFGENPAIAGAADRIAKSMGASELEAKKILNAVLENPAADLSALISDFLTKVWSPKTLG